MIVPSLLALRAPRRESGRFDDPGNRGDVVRHPTEPTDPLADPYPPPEPPGEPARGSLREHGHEAPPDYRDFTL
jgi:hypothetical protein